MSSSVCVLTPNGRRQTVKCTPNKTILQIIEEVCNKQGFKPDEYDVKHHNKVIDTTLSFRFSGLPNNAQLELVEATKTRVDSEVTLAINLEDGSRLMGAFQPDATLWAVLLELCPREAESGPNLVVVYMRNEIYGEALRSTTLRGLGLRGGRAMIRLLKKSPEELKDQANVSAPLPVKPAVEKPFHRTLQSSEREPEAESGTGAIPKVFQRKQEVDLVKLAREKRKLEETSPKKEEQAEVKLPKQKIRPELVKKDVIVENIPNEPLEDNFVFLGERNAMLFSLDTANSIPSESLPDDFFDLTIDDAKKILNDIRRNRSQAENANLMTAAMREMEESKKQLRHLNKYKQAVVRIQFPDRSILQGTFKPTETVQDVLDFANEYLEAKSNRIFVYTTPPKTILDAGRHLVEAGCVPGALLHLGTSAEDKSAIQLRENLRGKFTTNSVASLAVSKMRRTTMRADLETSENMEVEESVDSINTPGPSSQATSYERKVIRTTEKVPKWFKPSK